MTLPLILGPPLSPAYWKKVGAIQRANLIGYWSNHEPSGAASIDLSPEGNDGVFSNVTLAQPGIGDGRPSASFNGTTSRNNVYSAGLNTDFNGQEGALLSVVKVSGVGIYTDDTERVVMALRVDGDNYIKVIRHPTDNRLGFYYSAGGTVSLVFLNGVTNLGWMPLLFTWSKIADKVIAYYLGAQTGATQTTLGTWVGNLDSARVVIGATSTVPTAVWSGGIGPTLLWKVPLSGDEAKVASTL